MNHKTFVKLAASVAVALVVTGIALGQDERNEKSSKAAEVERLRKRIEDLEKQSLELMKAISEIKTGQRASTPAATGAAPTPAANGVGLAIPRSGYKEAVEAALNKPASAVSAPPPAGTITAVGTGNSRAARPVDQEESPLTFHIGRAAITPFGFLDLQTVFRSTNNGNGLPSNFGNIPFANTAQGQLTELRMSAQNSRLGLRVDTEVGSSLVTGYVEADFLGFAPTNISVTTNNGTFRVRQYYVDIKKGKFEVLGGQAWSLITPGRRGISPELRDIYYGEKNYDPNEELGLVWTRAAQFRLAYHATDSVHLAVSLENPEQYIGGAGGAGTIVLPTALSAAYGSQLNSGATTLAVPNLHPDIVTKIAFDPKVGDRLFHLEFGGIERTFKVYNPLVKQSFTSAGGGGFFNVNFELFKNFHLLVNNFYGDGGGRYLFGQAPDLVVRGDGSLSLIHSAANITGFEAQLGSKTSIGAYYGMVYAARNAVVDPTGGHLVGYGFPGSPSSQNRVIHEPTFDFSRTLWRDPKYGGLLVGFQYSYVIRHPWAVAPGMPTDAHSNMLYLDLRYVLPGERPNVSNK